eukprot:TRINITY_DN27061_c0_g1_i1.p1 TRINITY_DN27061_c0_g1~~TRINITY_DN27061_c0_g1_i1.p1  ORF type:complete len:103 (-),score=33.02 TRINITY_DN27061_c0_g1_i1:434-742(-)
MCIRDRYGDVCSRTMEQLIPRTKVNQAVDLMDADHDGNISVAECARLGEAIFGHAMTEEQVLQDLEFGQIANKPVDHVRSWIVANCDDEGKLDAVIAALKSQ